MCEGRRPDTVNLKSNVAKAIKKFARNRLRRQNRSPARRHRR